MRRIRSEKFIGEKIVNGERLSEVIVEIDCDTSSDLPTATELPGRVLGQGSVAWDISTGDFYGLNSSGVWIKQTGTEESAGE